MSQKHQDDEKSLRNLSKLSCIMNLLHQAVSEKTIREQRLWSPRFQIEATKTSRDDRLNAIRFKIKQTIENSRLIKLTENQSKYTVSLTFRRCESSMQQAKSYLKCKRSHTVSQERCWLCKSWSWKKQQLTHRQSSSHSELPNKQ